MNPNEEEKNLGADCGGGDTKEDIHIDEEDCSAIFTARFSALSTAERENELYAIHGITEPLRETPELVKEKIADLLRILDQIQEDRGAFDLALAQDSAKVRSDEFLLRFLRSTMFDVNQAAIKVPKYFAMKRRLFGDERLVEDLTLQDLGMEGRQLLESGWLSLLPLLDSAGRSVAMFLLGIKETQSERFTPEIRQRVIFYFIQTMLPPERATVVLNINMGPHHSNNRSNYAKNADVATSHWIRHDALHFIDDFEDAASHLVPKGFSSSLEIRTQTRLRFHSVKPFEYEKLHFILGTFGIPTQVLPLKINGEVDLTYHRELIKGRENVEAEQRRLQADAPTPSGSFNVVTTPGNLDVIRGNDSFARNHIGNLKFSKLVEDLFDEYNSTPRGQKRKIYKKVLDMVHGYGGTFLERGENGTWKECDEEGAFEKIGNGLRSYRRHLKNIQTQNQDSYTEARPLKRQFNDKGVGGVKEEEEEEEDPWKAVIHSFRLNDGRNCDRDS